MWLIILYSLTFFSGQHIWHWNGWIALLHNYHYQVKFHWNNLFGFWKFFYAPEWICRDQLIGMLILVDFSIKCTIVSIKIALLSQILMKNPTFTALGWFCTQEKNFTGQPRSYSTWSRFWSDCFIVQLLMHRHRVNPKSSFQVLDTICVIVRGLRGTCIICVPFDRVCGFPNNILLTVALHLVPWCRLQHFVTNFFQLLWRKEATWGIKTCISRYKLKLSENGPFTTFYLATFELLQSLILIPSVCLPARMYAHRDENTAVYTIVLLIGQKSHFLCTIILTISP